MLGAMRKTDNATDEKNICKDYINWEPGKMA